MVHVPMPDVETRKRLWRSVFPPEAPLQAINLDLYAENFELAGSNIKNIAASAAYLAAAKDKAIGQGTLPRR